MSAICAYFDRTGQQLAAEHIQVMMSELAIYGHDGAATCSAGAIALGRQSLNITPEDQSARRLFVDSSSQLIVAADVRLDNRDDLLPALEVAPADRRSVCDSQLIALAYRRWGTECAAHLLGDFAFAIWDERLRRVFCARDILGVRPFYYHLTPQRFLLASDPCGVLGVSGISDELDLEFVSAHFRNYWNYPHASRTYFSSVLKLPPAHAMVVDADRFSIRTYWDPASSPEVRCHSIEQYTERLRDLLESAVKARLRTTFAVGSHLSGGLDSSAMAVLAARHTRDRGNRVTGFSWAPSPDSDSGVAEDERRHVEQIGRVEGIPVNYSAVTPRDVLEVYFPSARFGPDAELVHELPIRRSAAAQGIRTMLSGWGGDQLITSKGGGYFADLFRCGRWWRMSRELSRCARINGWTLWKAMLTRGVFPVLPDRIAHRVAADRLPLGWQDGPLPEMLLVDFDEQLKAVTPLPAVRPRERPGLRAGQLAKLAGGQITRRMEGWAAAGGRQGLTYAYPLLDRRIVEFSLGIPPELYVSRGWLRYLFRIATSGILPDQVRWNKTKAEPALNRSRASNRGLSQRIRLRFLHELLAQRGACRYLDVTAARESLEARMRGQASRFDGGVGGALFVELLVNRELACDLRQHIDRFESSQPMAA